MSDALRTALAGATGRTSVRQCTETDAVAGVVPLAWIEPDGVEELCRVLELCSAEGLPVEPAGAGTWLAAGAPPAAPPVVLSTTRLNRVVEHEPADLVAGVQAGMPLATLDARFAEFGQMLPLDPSAAAGATIGATVSLGTAGPLRMAHGTPRDLLLGVEVVTGDGRLLRFGGRVVKNVAGYDTVRLMAGSRGSLGVLVSMFLLLRSLPEADETYAVAAGSAGEAQAAADALLGSTPCEALEILSPALAQEIGLEDRWYAAARLRGSAAAVADGRDRLAAATSVSAPEQHGGSGLWRRLSSAESGAGLCIRLTRERAELGRTLAGALELTQALPAGVGGPWRMACHVAAGTVRLWLPATTPAAAHTAGAAATLPDAEEAADTLRRMRAAVAGAGGSLHAPVLPAWLAPHFEAFQRPAPATLALMERIKAVFDPAGILAPGRHVL
jgi:glycolate oxidase FAD binding subunit